MIRKSLMLMMAASLSLSAVPSFAYTIPAAGQGVQQSDNTEALQKLSKGVAQIAKQANQAIVLVSIYKSIQTMPSGMVDPFDFFFGMPGRGGGRQQIPQDENPRSEKREAGLGSGFFIDVKKGYIITNNHVVQGADEIHLKLANGESAIGKVVGRDANTDVAVVQVKNEDFNRKGLGDLSLGNSDALEVGDFVVALGAPFGLEASLSFGVVSAVGRRDLHIAEINDFIQTDAAINPGNSGGPLIDMRGQVIGMNTAIYSRSGGYNGIGFAVPSRVVRTVAEQLINTGKVRRGYLGVGLQPIDDEMQGSLSLPDGVRGAALVATVRSGSPAQKAGIESGDVIVEVNGNAVHSPGEITTTIGLTKPGSNVSLALYREGKKKSMQVTVGDFPNENVADEGGGHGGNHANSPQAFGMTTEDVNKQLQQRFGFESKKGAVVTLIEDGSAAERAGLRPGDVILKVDNRKVESADQFRKMTKGKDHVLVYIERSGEYYFQKLRQ